MPAPFFALRLGGTAVPVAWAIVFDLVCVAAFVGVGRANHQEGGALLGALSTAWPFVTALALAWAVVSGATALSPGQAQQRATPARVLAAGALIWAITVIGGLLMRVAAGVGGAPLSFAIVTAVFLAVTLLGWRAAALWQATRAARRTRAAPTG